MPKTPKDFSKGLIYSIICKTDETLIYVGSTTNFTKRKNAHKSTCVNENSKHHNSQVYVMIRDNGGWDNFDMKPVKEFPCDNVIQLKIEEERIRVELQANLNARRAYITSEEQKADKKKYDIEYQKIHKEKIHKLKQKHYIEHKEQILEKSRVYRENNKQQISDQKKQYREANRAKINERRKIKRQEIKNAL